VLFELSLRDEKYEEREKRVEMSERMCQWVLEVEEDKCMGKALGVGILLN